MIKEGADYESVADKASKLMDRSALNRAKLVKNDSEVSDLLNLKEKYSKNDKFLLYKMNDRALNNNPTFIFKTSLTALEIASQLNRESNHFLSSCYVYFNANEKRTKNMTVFTLSVYHPLLQKQIPLATIDCEKEDCINAKNFFATWNEALSEFQEGLTFDSTGVILDERGSNWNAIKEIYGEEFLNRCQSCEFHFKQSVNRRLKSSGLFAGDRARDKMRSLSRKLLESETTIQFEKACEGAVKFIEEKEKRKPLKAWLDWWLSREEHIFHAFKRKFSPQSNLAEVIHSSWVTQKRTHLSAYETAVYDICEIITVKRMLQGYADVHSVLTRVLPSILFKFEVKQEKLRHV